MATQPTKKQKGKPPSPPKGGRRGWRVLLGGPSFFGNLVTTVLIFLLLMSAYSLVTGFIQPSNTIALSTVAADVAAGKITAITVNGDSLELTYADSSTKTSRKDPSAGLHETLATYGVTPEELAKVSITIQGQSGFEFWFLTLAPIVLPLLFIVFLFWFLTRQVRGAGMQAFTFGQSKARIIDPSDSSQRVTFADVAGAREAKEELLEIVDFLKNPKKFLEIGARIPKGIILMGAPGTGKTLLARAVAGEAGVPFFSISGSEFVEMFVGVGASRVRDLFQLAKKAAPAIIFVDEIDAVGRVRGAGVGGGNDEREQTLNQILVEMDGFEPAEKVVVMAASVTGDTPILVRKGGVHVLKPIAEIVDPYYAEGEEGAEKDATGLEVLGFNRKRTQREFKNPFFGSSAFKAVRSVFRHRVTEVYEVTYPGGLVRTTANHSVFVRTRTGIKPKCVDELTIGEELVNIPYIANRTAAREVRAHTFPTKRNWSRILSVYEPVERPYAAVRSTYAFVREYAGFLSQRTLGESIGVSQRTVGLWQGSDRLPRGISRAGYAKVVPEEVEATPELMRLFGYFVAEGYARKEVDFCFNASEREYQQDVISLMRSIFDIEPSAIRAHTESAVNIIYYSKPLAAFFAAHAGTKARGKHVPEFLFDAPREHFVEFLKGYARGDGSIDKRERLVLTSVSRQLLVELQWLSRMHGHHSHLWSYTVPAGRTINGGKPLKETLAWRLGFGKTQNPFDPKPGKASIARAKIKNIRRVSYDGYVYDFCGCENEAFFGGVAPVLLHNTNRPDVLDPALLRPGRFDRRVTIDLPDRRDREEILAIHGRKSPLGPDVALAVIAERTPGFSGAELYSIMNEGAILAAREERKEVTQYDLIRSIEKVMLGPERKSHLLTKKEKELTAYHEAGHALVSSVLENADPVHKISIISRGRAAGYTLKLPFEDKKMQSKKQFLDDIAATLGGYVAEEMLFNDVTTGPSNDLVVVTALARDMVSRYGMSDKLGPIAFGDRQLGNEPYSERVAAEIDDEVTRIIGEAKARAKKVISEHRGALDAIAKELIEKETVERSEFEKILVLNGITPKKRDEDLVGTV